MKLIFGQTGSKIATVRVTFDAGSSVELDQWTSGIAHLAEHMVFQSPKNTTHQELMRIMAKLGVSWNAFTSHAKVSFFINAPHENIEEATRYFSDLMLNRKLTSEAFLKEKMVVLEEERGSHDDIDTKIYEELDKFLCNGPLAIPILGTKESISSIELDELEEFFGAYYNPSQMLVTITSPNPDHEKLGELFGKPGRFVRSPKINNEYKKRRSLYARTDAIKQARVMVCYRTFPIKDKSTLDLQFVEKFFSNGMDSRLFEVLRQKYGLCYSTGSFPIATDDIGWFVIFINTGQENIKKSAKLINKEVQRLLSEGPTREEILRAKNKFISEIYQGLETSYGLNSVLDYRAFYGLPKIDVSINRIKRMSKKKIMDVCERVFRPELRQIFYVIPEKEE